MDSGFSYLSHYSHSSWVRAFLFGIELKIEFDFHSFSVFVPQLATLPTDNSTSEWDNVKYLINHFDSSRVEDSISFAIFTLSLIGFLFLVFYTVKIQ